MIFTIVRRMYDCSRTTGETPLSSFRTPVSLPDYGLCGGLENSNVKFLPSVLKVGEWRLRIEKFDTLDVLRTDRITPVGIENVRYHARLVGWSKADVAR